MRLSWKVVFKICIVFCVFGALMLPYHFHFAFLSVIPDFIKWRDYSYFPTVVVSVLNFLSFFITLLTAFVAYQLAYNKVLIKQKTLKILFWSVVLPVNIAVIPWAVHTMYFIYFKAATIFTIIYTLSITGIIARLIIPAIFYLAAYKANEDQKMPKTPNIIFITSMMLVIFVPIIWIAYCNLAEPKNIEIVNHKLGVCKGKHPGKTETEYYCIKGTFVNKGYVFIPHMYLDVYLYDKNGAAIDIDYLKAPRRYGNSYNRGSWAAASLGNIKPGERRDFTISMCKRECDMDVKDFENYKIKRHIPSHPAGFKAKVD